MHGSHVVWSDGRMSKPVKRPQSSKTQSVYGRCGEPVPKRLCGDLGAFKCGLEIRRTGTHDGDHRAHLSIPGVGKLIWKWKNTGTTRQVSSSQPPVVLLPVRCGCPEWWKDQGQKRHYAPTCSIV